MRSGLRSLALLEIGVGSDGDGLRRSIMASTRRLLARSVNSPGRVCGRCDQKLQSL